MGFWPRIAIVLTLTVVAYGPVYIALATSAIRGSRTAYLLVTPILSVMLANRFRHAPRGVGDAESDWIVAIVVGGAGYTVIQLIARRLPAAANLWHLHLFAIVLWVACSTAIVLGVRHGVRMGGLWMFATVCAGPMPYLLVTASLGGSDTAAGFLAAGLGVTAVFWSGKPTVFTWRAFASVTCMCIAIAAVFALRGTNLLITVIVAGGVIPAIHAIALHHVGLATNGQRLTHPPDRFARRSWTVFASLAALAAALLCTNLQSVHGATLTVAHADWMKHSPLAPAKPTEFAFIARFLGRDSTLTRYPVTPITGRPDAAVDVISTTNVGALEDFSDASWYATGAPVNPTVADIGVSTPVAIRAVHSNADSAASDSVPDWYGLTWVWRSASIFQQVTVVVSQSEHRTPPEPRPLTLENTMIQPLLWIARQQPDSVGVVNGAVVQRADEIARQIIAAGVPVVD